MKKYYIRPIIIIVSIIAMVLTLDHLSKNKLSVETIEGSLKDIGDVSLVYTPQIEDLKREEIVISKDGVNSYKVDNNIIGRDYIDIDKKYNDFVKQIPSNKVFQDENYIGTMHVAQKGSFEDTEYELLVRLKSKKNESISEYIIPIQSGDDVYDSIEVSYTTLHNENIYIVGSDGESGYIAKIDLNKKSYTLMHRIVGASQQYREPIIFKNEDRIYIENTSRIHIGSSREIKRADFYIYDINKNKVKINESYEYNESNDTYRYDSVGGHTKSVMIDEQILDINIRDNILTVVSNFNLALLKTEYTINNDSVKLKDIESYSHQIGFDYSYREYNQMKSVEIVDDKIYTLYQDPSEYMYKDEGTFPEIIKGSKPIELTVFDMKNNEVVYKANLITQDKWINYSFHFVNNY